MVILPSRRKNFTSQAPSGDSDPYWSNVTFLSKFDETGLGLGVFRDVSSNPSSVTRANTNTILNTGSSVLAPKFGSGNIYFTTTTSSATTANSLSKFLLTNQEWTVEGWFAPFGIPGLAGRAVFTVSNFCRITSQTTTGLWNFQSSLNNFVGALNIASNVQLITGAWNHIAIQRMRNVSTFRYDAYLNGVFINTITNSGNHGPGGTTSGILLFAAGGNNNSLAFMADEIRVTSGVARYATGVNFTPPTQPYPSQ